jgi:O-antigen ligase
MLGTPLRDQVSRYLAYAAFGATVVISPWTNFDPVNIVKMIALALFGFIAFGHLLPKAKEIWAGPYKLIIALVAAFILQMVIVMVVDDSPITQQFFGTFGRNTGFISYLSLSLILLSSAIVCGYRQARRISLALLAAGIFNVVYGWMQLQGIDPVPWSNEYNVIIGTLGNPNFSAALFGFTCVVALSILVGNGISVLMRCGAFAVFVFAFYLSIATQSSQGPIIAAVGSTVVVYQFIAKTLNWKWARLPYLVLLLLGMIVSVLGTLQRGPLSSILYQDSVAYRGDYWRAGIKMTLQNPLTGVGLDSYGDYYRASRTIFATERRGPDVISNSAHNVFLDISAAGGLPLLIIYLAIIALAVRATYRILSRAEKFDWVPISLVGAWIGYLTQSTLSINQLGLAVWGWIIPGVLIGMDLNAKVTDTAVKDKRGRRIYAPAKHLVAGMALGALAISISFWPMRYDANVRYSLATKSAENAMAAVQEFPITNYYILFVAKQMFDQKQYDRAIELFKMARDNNPRDYFAWKGLAQFPGLPGEDRATILAKMRELDPNNKTIPAN